MSNQMISYADLSGIRSALGSIESYVQIVGNKVDQVDNSITITRSELADLRQQLQAFEQRYNQQTEIGHAETRLIKVRQELDTKYGHHAEIRRAANGILQAADIKVVRQDTINTVTEELMLLAPGYWLAPALVALACWLKDDRKLAERALKEALRRDDEKTSLCFALICRRAQRVPACRTWLARYLEQQDPFALKRETIVLIDAVAGGIFPPDVQRDCSGRFQAWLDDLADKPDFVEDQRSQWKDALTFQMPDGDHSGRYPHLARYCPIWADLNRLIDRVSLAQILLDHLRQIFETPLPSAAHLAEAVDAQLVRLVSDHDVEELPLRREEALLQTIIDEGGRIDVAQAKHDLQTVALEEMSSFTQLLTNAAMHSEKSGATRASQRFALSLSRDWVRDAFLDLSLATDRSMPAVIPIALDDWTGSTRDGANEEELVADLSAHIADEEQAALAAVTLDSKHVLVGAIGAIVLVYGLFNSLLLVLLGAAAGAFLGYHLLQLEPRRQAFRDAYAARLENHVALLRASIAEAVEWRRDIAQRDAVGMETEAYIESIQPSAYLVAPHDQVRAIAATSS